MELYTTTQVAKELGVVRSTLFGWQKQNRAVADVVVGKTMLYTKQTLDILKYEVKTYGRPPLKGAQRKELITP